MGIKKKIPFIICGCVAFCVLFGLALAGIEFLNAVSTHGQKPFDPNAPQSFAPLPFLQFRLVHEDNDKLVQEYQAAPDTFKIPEGYEKMIEEFTPAPKGKSQNKIFFVSKTREMDGRNITEAYPTIDPFGQVFIGIAFNSAGTKKFAAITEKNVGRQLAIVLAGKLCSAPTINQPINGGRAQISGNFTEKEAAKIAKGLCPQQQD